MYLARPGPDEVPVDRVDPDSLLSFLHDSLEQPPSMVGELFCKGPKHRYLRLSPHVNLGKQKRTNWVNHSFGCTYL